MKTKFVMIKCEAGKAHGVADKVVELLQVSEIYTVSGDYDLLIKCDLPDATKVDDFIIKHIQTLTGVSSTHTLNTHKWFA